MKNLFFTAFLWLVCVTNVQAKNEVTIKSGDPASLKNAGEVTFEFDYTQTTIEGKPLMEYLQGRGDDFVRDWPGDSEKAATYFPIKFNKKNKLGITLVPSSNSAKYKLVIHVTKFDMGNGASAFVPFGGAKAGGVIMWGTAEFIDINTGNPCCTLEIDEVKGIGHPSEAVRRGLTYMELSKKMLKLLQ